MTLVFGFGFCSKNFGNAAGTYKNHLPLVNEDGEVGMLRCGGDI